jgi:hypothetical protein
MFTTTTSGAEGERARWIRIAALAGATLLVVACSTAPTMRDVETVTADTRIAYGSVDVFGDKGEPEKWGARWTGYNYFYVTILPAGRSDAITYQLDDDGMFYWALEPGDYTLLGYHWTKAQTQRTGHFGADFRVPESGGDVYLGSIELRSTGFGLVPIVVDRFDEMAVRYGMRFPGRRGASVSALVDMPGMLGNVGDYRYQCHEAWGIECSDRFSGVTPVTPDCKKTGFPMIQTLQPTFKWQASSREDVTYDLVLYEAARYSLSGMMGDSYMRGRRVAYVEDLKQSSWAPETPLRPDTRYFWSVRMRDGETVSGWSTQSHFTFMLVAWSSGYGNWFQFRTS